MNDGFAIVTNVLDGPELESLSRAIDAMPFRRSRAGARHLLSVPAVMAIARDPRLTGMAREALGHSPIPFGATLFEKSPDANWLVAWHQDTALPLQVRQEAVGWGPWSEKNGVLYAHAPAATLERVVAIRVHLDDSTKENGPLRVLPGTHTLGVLTDDRIQRMAKRLDPVECIVERGGLIVMRPLLLHASSKVVAAASRRVIHIQYAAATAFDGVRLRVA